MSLSQKILGVEIGEISLEILQSFFQEEREESDVLEFKSFHTEKNNQNDFRHKEDAVLRTICAFLNSNGGLLVWGAPAEKKGSDGDGKKKITGKLSPVEKDIEKDSFISKLANRIIPSPSGIKFGKIKVEDNKFVYVIEVEQSPTKPHQVNNIYYMRLDGQTVTAPHHYIEALFKQIKYPDLRGYIKFEKLDVDRMSNSYQLNIGVIIFNFSPFQNEENVSFQLTVFPGFIDNEVDDRISYHAGGAGMKFKNMADVLHYRLPHRHDVLVFIKPEDLILSRNEVIFALDFGGRFSPRKLSSYKMRIGNSLLENSTSLVSTSEENILIYDLSKDEGTIEETVNKLLKR